MEMKKILGYVKDANNDKFAETFCDNKTIKEIYIDVYSSNPFSKPRPSLLLRHYEEKPQILNDNKNLIVKKHDKYNTYIMDILMDNINEVYFQDNNEFIDFVINYQNIYYKVTIFN